ncbi:MOSC domain-containing protein [Dactylosporangium vinaceum]|uniref:MOSC domain-containing protein n=1 Tax=Dactylosporangium vinaceum TaxID=53362 RepID=A0ABV5MRU4_9ACTN|nr:MOSC N-terminal beta barrel domain-containing protein [Dactylosporangium vinaceum]UAC00340.1 MOSC domain-containing protein [Dactylosporangium vinaceum]
MRIVEIRRYPVKSMLGETLTAATVGPRGLDGDRLWAVRGPDGKFGSGKHTRRFRRMDGLFDFRAAIGGPLAGADARTGGPVPEVELPDGRRFAADDPLGHHAVSAALGHTVTLTPEAGIPHHDEGPVSIITTAGLRLLASFGAAEPDGAPVDATRFRANLLIDSDVVEDHWAGRSLHAGPEVVLRVVRPLTRCVMIDLAQDAACAHGELLKLLAAHHDMTFGVFATVERPGTLAVDDECFTR